MGRAPRQYSFHSLGAPLAYAADALVAVVLAPRCAACSRPLDRPTQGVVCETCWHAVESLLAPLCRTCGAGLSSWRALDPPFDRCLHCRERPGLIAVSRSAGRYAGALRQIVHAFKFEGRRTLAPRLGRMIREAGSDVLSGAACVVPVPLHPWRRVTRGFNQAADLAAHLELPVVPALWRTRATRAQSGLGAAGRQRNVRAAFAMSPLLSRRARLAIAGRVVVLVDDVRTTGATLEACAQVLAGAGAAEVRALTAALADSPIH